MSLDVYLQFEIDTGGPGPEHIVTVFDANYTHNCGLMAKESGVYGVVWRPEENGVESAADLIEPLRQGIAAMEDDPKRFIALNPANGWGSYETFLPWLREYLEACVRFPKAKVVACR